MAASASFGFERIGLDDRLKKAITKLNWVEPTLIQEKAIPLALEGNDLLLRARTGCGKTAAVAIPIIQKLLVSKPLNGIQAVRCVVLAPSRELCNQIHKHFQQLISSCSREISCVDISVPVDLEQQKPVLIQKPDIVVGTPSRVLAHLKAGNLDGLKKSFETLVMDEADLLFSFGYEQDILKILDFMPAIFQSFLMSATLSDDVKMLKKLVLRNPIVLKLEEPNLPDVNQLTQYVIRAEEEDKFVLIYALFKLSLIRGRTIIFVNTVDKCYRVKLYMEQFRIKSCVLNSELPINSRCHIVTQFNEGYYDVIIASDETTVTDPTRVKGASNAASSCKRNQDKEYGVSRGIDFQFVSNVINFDFPLSAKAYVHRIGRTARGKNTGSALSFVSIQESKALDLVEEDLTSQFGSNVLQPYQFKMEEIEGFRYRARDAIKAVTRAAVRETRLKEIRRELLKSDKLKTYFVDNPKDLQRLRHDQELHTVRLASHLKDIPDYIIPPTLKKLARVKRSKPDDDSANDHKKRDRFKQGKMTKTQQKFQKRKADPLKSFDFVGLAKIGKR